MLRYDGALRSSKVQGSFQSPGWETLIAVKKSRLAAHSDSKRAHANVVPGKADGAILSRR